MIMPFLAAEELLLPALAALLFAPLLPVFSWFVLTEFDLLVVLLDDALLLLLLVLLVGF